MKVAAGCLAHPTAGALLELSKYGILQNGLDIKFWAASLPRVGEVRPRSCPRCGAPASRIQGHGVVSRWVRAVFDDDGPPVDLEIKLRRYHCRNCRAVMRVGPTGVVAHRRYSLPTILFALALWSLERRSTHAVRQRVSPDRVFGAASIAQRWTTLMRWGRTLISSIASSGSTLRDATASALRTVATKLGGLGLGPPTPAQVFHAAHQIDEALLRTQGA